MEERNITSGEYEEIFRKYFADKFYPTEKGNVVGLSTAINAILEERIKRPHRNHVVDAWCGTCNKDVSDEI